METEDLTQLPIEKETNAKLLIIFQLFFIIKQILIFIIFSSSTRFLNNHMDFQKSRLLTYMSNNENDFHKV